jgi:hypothetical protein
MEGSLSCPGGYVAVSASLLSLVWCLYSSPPEASTRMSHLLQAVYRQARDSLLSWITNPAAPAASQRFVMPRVGVIERPRRPRRQCTLGQGVVAEAQRGARRLLARPHALRVPSQFEGLIVCYGVVCYVCCFWMRLCVVCCVGVCCVCVLVWFVFFCVLYICFRGAIGAMDSVSDFESGGCGFESRIAYSMLACSRSRSRSRSGPFLSTGCAVARLRMLRRIS